MRILLLFSLIMILPNCATVEVAKEVTKASKSIKTSVSNMIKGSDIIQSEGEGKKEIDQEIESLEKEKRAKEIIIKEQKKKTKINFLGKDSDEIQLILGDPLLLRIDGNSRTLRFDNDFCQLFLFSNLKSKGGVIDYFEIRNRQGKLIINKEKIEKCYKNFNLI